MTNEQVKVLATAMETVADRAAWAGKEGIIGVIDKADDLDDRQKIGALLTAATVIYASIIETASKLNEPTRELARGLYTTMTVPALRKLED